MATLRFFSGEQRALAAKRIDRMRIGFLIWASGWLVLVLGGVMDSNTALIVALITLWIGMLTFLGNFGPLAGQVGRSRIVWVTAALVCGPLGLVVAYYTILNDATKHSLFGTRKMSQIQKIQATYGAE